MQRNVLPGKLWATRCRIFFRSEDYWACYRVSHNAQAHLLRLRYWFRYAGNPSKNIIMGKLLNYANYEMYCQTNHSNISWRLRIFNYCYALAKVFTDRFTTQTIWQSIQKQKVSTVIKTGNRCDEVTQAINNNTHSDTLATHCRMKLINSVSSGLALLLISVYKVYPVM